MSTNPQNQASVDLLGEAMYNVIKHAVQEGLAPVCTNMQTLGGQVQTLHGEVQTLRGEVHTLRKDMQGMEVRIRKELNDRIDTTNKNMQAQFAEQEKKIGRLLNRRAA